MTVACYNPEKDPDGAHCARIVDALEVLLAPVPAGDAAADPQPT
jgi:hypothetical protein